MKMKTHMTVIGFRIKEKVLAPSNLLTEEFTLVIGKTTKNTVLQTQLF